MQKETIRVLIVDDNALMCKLLVQCLIGIGITDITLSANGKDALDCIKSAHIKGQRYNLIMADWNMPLMSGLELLKKIKDDFKMMKTAFIMISAESGKEKIAEVMAAGGTAYIVKPFSPHDISKHMVKVLNWLEEASLG